MLRLHWASAAAVEAQVICSIAPLGRASFFPTNFLDSLAELALRVNPTIAARHRALTGHAEHPQNAAASASRSTLAAVAATSRPALLPLSCTSNGAKKKQLPSSATEAFFLKSR
jgi:hypothetical protein